MRRVRPSAMQVVAVTSGAAWVWSWYTMYLEIHRWKHVTRSFRFSPPPPIPGTSIQPRPGLPLRAMFVCAAGAPVVFASAVAAGTACSVRPGSASNRAGMPERSLPEVTEDRPGDS